MKNFKFSYAVMALVLLASCSEVEGGGGGSSFTPAGGGTVGDVFVSPDAGILLGMQSTVTGPAKHPTLGQGQTGGILDAITATRIPGMYTLMSGTVVVAADARGKAISDSPNNIDSFVQRSTDNGDTFANAITNHVWLDYAWDHTGGWKAYSTSFIDSAMVQAKNGDLISVVNGFSAGGGIWNSDGSRNPISSPFYDKDGKRYLLLINADDNAWSHTSDDITKYTNVVLLGSYDDEVPGSAVAEFDDVANRRSTIKGLNQDGTIGDAVTKDGSSDWEVDEFWTIYKDDVVQEVDQRDHPDGAGIKTDANVMFADAPFRTLKTSFAFINVSKDEGLTWSKYSKDISWQFRNSMGEGIFGKEANTLNDIAKAEGVGGDAERSRQMYIVSPGRGHRMTTGEYEDRIFNILYDVPFTSAVTGSGGGNCMAIAIYSDDNGVTWHRGGEVKNLPSGAGRASETQVVEAPNGDVILFARGAGYITMYQSTDGGDTWDDGASTGLYDGQWNGTMVSAINLRLTKGANDEALIAFSHPNDGGSRVNGTVRIAELRQNRFKKWELIWKDGETDYSYTTLVGPDLEAAATRSFGYSVLTELTNGNLGLFNEGPDSKLEYYEIELLRMAVE